MPNDVSAKEGMEELRARVDSLTWVHSIDLGNGIVTPGIWGKPQPLIMKAFDDLDFKGRKVLDVGCWDGLWSFEAERRGAGTVYATDEVSQRSYKEQETFQLAHRVLKSRVKYYPDLSVFDIQSLGVNDFDMVLFCGVHYHLRDPLLALARLRRVTQDGGLILVEGDVIYGTEECSADFFYRRSYGKDESVWWVPTVPCLREWVESSFFEIVKEYSLVAPPPASGTPRAGLRRFWSRRPGAAAPGPKPFYNRLAILARATRRRDPHYIFPEPEFKEFDLNNY
jgi:tRNA (mo5U34)-methyltransferase